MPENKQTDPVPRPVLEYFLETYLKRFLSLFPNAIILVAGGKAKQRLSMLDIQYIPCWAFTRPGANHPKAKKSWIVAGEQIAAQLAEPPTVKK